MGRTRELTGNTKVLPSGIYKEMLISRLFKRYRFDGRGLEVGCATGEFLLELADRGLEGVGIDVCEDSLRIAKERLQGRGFEVERADLFGYMGETFDAAFIFEVLEHIEDDVGAMRKLWSLLSSGGLLLLSVPAKQKLFTEEDHFQGHVRRYEKAEMAEKLEGAGFQVLEFWCYNPLPYVRKWLMKRGEGRIKEGVSMDRKTQESAFDMHPFTRKWVDRLHPIYSRMSFLLRFQDLFLRTDFGAHYLVLARKPSPALSYPAAPDGDRLDGNAAGGAN